MEEKQLRHAVKLATDIGVNTATVKRIQGILQLIDDGHQETFLKLQLQAASKSNDGVRLVRVKGALRQLFLKQTNGKYEFELAPSLRSPEDWAKIPWWCWDRASLARGMLMYSEEPLHAPLTTFSAVPSSSVEKMADDAIRFFSDLLLYLKSETAQEERDRATTLWQEGRDLSHMRNEFYLQIMKQLTNCPNDQRRERCWRLMGLYVKRIVPQGLAMECVIENFLMRFDARTYIADFHQLLFAPNPPQHSPNDLNNPAPPRSSWEQTVYRAESIQKLRSC